MMRLSLSILITAIVAAIWYPSTVAAAAAPQSANPSAPSSSTSDTSASAADPALRRLRNYLSTCESFFNPSLASSSYLAYVHPVAAAQQPSTLAGDPVVGDTIIRSYLSCKLNPPPATWVCLFSFCFTLCVCWGENITNILFHSGSLLLRHKQWQWLRKPMLMQHTGGHGEETTRCKLPSLLSASLFVC